MAKTKNALEGYVNVKVEDGKIKMTARWADKEGETHDCGFVLAPSWNAARRHAAILGEAIIDAAQRKSKGGTDG